MDGRVDLGAYATSGPLVAAGAVGGLDMTTEAAYTKLVVLLSEGHPPDEVRTPAGDRPRGRAHRLRSGALGRDRHTAAMRHNELLDRALSHHLLPDSALLLGSRVATQRRLKSEREGGVEAQEDRLRSLVWHMSHGPILEVPERSASRTTSCPPSSSSSSSARGTSTRARSGRRCQRPRRGRGGDARLTCERAQIEDGMDILDLGCGWGSLSLWLGEQYPNARVTGIAISDAQREHIEPSASSAASPTSRSSPPTPTRYDPGRDVDRVVSVEMFEHMRNWKELLRRISGA